MLELLYNNDVIKIENVINYFFSGNFLMVETYDGDKTLIQVFNLNFLIKIKKHDN